MRSFAHKLAPGQAMRRGVGPRTPMHPRVWEWAHPCAPNHHLTAWAPSAPRETRWQNGDRRQGEPPRCPVGAACAVSRRTPVAKLDNHCVFAIVVSAFGFSSKSSRSFTEGIGRHLRDRTWHTTIALPRGVFSLRARVWRESSGHFSRAPRAPANFTTTGRGM